MDTTVSRRMWQLFEPLHTALYFTPQARTALDAAGMKGYWMGYVAARIAPMGPVGPAVATSVFYGFHPSRAARALPDAWGLASPEELLVARRLGSAAALRALLGDEACGSAQLREAAAQLWAASQYADTTGRVLGAANQALPEPDEPLEMLWQAAGTLREHRGDGHIACLVARGVDPVQSHVLLMAAGGVDDATLTASRAWPDEAWIQAREGLTGRGWLDRDGTLTSTGAAARDEIERATDAAALSPWRGLGEEATDRLDRLLWPLTSLVADSGMLPWPNPIGLPRAEASR